MNVDAETLGILDRGSAEGKLFRLPPEQLDRPVYLKVNKVLELAGGKWDRRAKGHAFPASAAESLEGIFLTGSIIDAKKEFQFFETPQILAERMVAMLALGAGARVLEPSAGRGRLAIEARRTGATVTCVEIQEDCCRCLETSAGVTAVYHADFLTMEPGGAAKDFDAVIMNPPFAKSAEARHIVHALRFLRPGGRLASVASAGARSRRTGAYGLLHAELAHHDHAWHTVPGSAFKAEGTDVRVEILAVNKRG